ncbi:MAG: UDP-glucose 6-dehydrogenase [Rickettsiales bacterium]|nr:UDP-glucose 6-dehydrogenase [Rickettsiales bacterium]|tara:strand:+ start:1588 stop:2949 length:1362 start_codon:yes stop_codon:yes gene_type:complete
MKIIVVGTGYVGLVTGTCLADLGNSVTCIDSNPDKLAVLKTCKSPFYEPGLDERLKRNVDAGRLNFTASLKDSFSETGVFFNAVGTPPMESGESDLSYVYAVVNEFFKIYKELGCTDFKVLITKSTVPVGTGSEIEAIRDSHGITENQVAILSNPEFLREGTAIYDFFHPDRIVIGSSSEKALDIVQELYGPLYRNETPIVRTSIQTSELSKYASNAFLATKISFINEMANLCELTGADVSDISKIMGMDGRIGKYFLHPGPGYGGSCFPKDTKALVYLAKQLGYNLNVVSAVEDVNESQKKRVMSYVLDYFDHDIAGKTFALLGISFKPNTDDVREASALTIIDLLLKQGAIVKAFDPEVKSLAQFEDNQNFSIVSDSYEAAELSDAIILVTEWNTFRELDLERLKSSMNNPSLFFDLRNVYSPEKLRDAGFETYVIGRKLLSSSQKITQNG